MKLKVFITVVTILFIISLITNSLSIKESLTFRSGRKNEPVLEMGNLVSKGEQYSLDCEKMCGRLSDCKFSIIHNGKPDRTRDNVLKGNCYVTQPNISKNEFYQVVNKKLKNNNKFQIKENKNYRPPSFKAKLKYIGNIRKPNNGWNAGYNCLSFGSGNKIQPFLCKVSPTFEFKPYNKTDYYTISSGRNYLNDFQKGNTKIQKAIVCSNNRCKNIGQFKLKKTDDNHITIVNKSGQITDKGRGWSSYFKPVPFSFSWSRGFYRRGGPKTFDENNKTKISNDGNWKLLNKSNL